MGVLARGRPVSVFWNVAADVELKLYPNPVLRVRCSAVREVNDEMYSRAHEMLEFMYDRDGLGLAAPQVGWRARVVALDVGGTKKGKRIFLNPRIVAREGELVHEEGCLSLPDVCVPLRRADKVKIAAYTLDGEAVELEADDVLARAWQHEIDHLNGVLIVDKLSPTEILEIRGKLKELEREFEEGSRA